LQASFLTIAAAIRPCRQIPDLQGFWIDNDEVWPQAAAVVKKMAACGTCP
jgi:hypothetical protein